MHAFKLFSSCPATSSATPGRASKFAPTTPIGMRRADTSSPLSSVQRSISRSSGGSSASASSCSPSAGRRGVVERQPVERPRVELLLGSSHIGRIRGENRVLVPREQLGRPVQSGRDDLVGEARRSRTGRHRLELDEP